jgi:DNA invertase Pin-like site-specific DNA recombinase
MNMKKYFIYARKSSESEDRQAQSIEDQISILSTLASDRKLTIVDTLSESKSAKAPNIRDMFSVMITRIQDKEATGIICWSLDRLTRNPVDAGTLQWLLQNGTLEEIATPSKTFTRQDSGIIMSVMAGVGNQFIIDLQKNTRRGLMSKAEKGWLPSGAKAGYMNDKYAEKGSKTILPDPDRFPLIRKAWDAMLTGTYSVVEILRLLNNEWGYQTPKHKRIGGKPMSRSQIYKTLTDPFYYGEFEYPTGSGIWRQGKHEPMITRDEFDKVQRLLGRKGRPRPRTRSFDYTGLLECGECHAMITAEEKFQIICPECKQKFASQNKSKRTPSGIPNDVPTNSDHTKQTSEITKNC